MKGKKSGFLSEEYRNFNTGIKMNQEFWLGVSEHISVEKMAAVLALFLLVFGLYMMILRQKRPIGIWSVTFSTLIAIGSMFYHLSQ